MGRRWLRRSLWYTLSGSDGSISGQARSVSEKLVVHRPGGAARTTTRLAAVLSGWTPTQDGTGNRWQTKPTARHPPPAVTETTRMEPRFLLMSDVAEQLNVSMSQVYHMVRSGELPAIKVGGRGQWRIERSKLEEYIQRKYDDTAAWVRENPLTGREDFDGE
jgi:excisionase family DNA binding protein